MQSINQKKEAMRRETQELLSKVGTEAVVRGPTVAVMPKGGSLGVDARGFHQCRLARRGK